MMKPPKRIRPLSLKAEQLIRLATARAYFRFATNTRRIRTNVANYLLLMYWIDEPRIEMEAEGRRYWVPTNRDFLQAMQDCWDDLVKPESSEVAAVSL